MPIDDWRVSRVAIMDGMSKNDARARRPQTFKTKMHNDVENCHEVFETDVD